MKKVLLRVSAGLGVAICSLSLLVASPQTSISAQAATGGGTTVSPQSDIITWVYKNENGKIYKRLWNGTKGVWIGDWIYVCDF